MVDLDDDLTEEELDRLAHRGTRQQMRSVAMHPNAKIQTLLYLAHNGFAEDVDQNPMMLLHTEVGSCEIVKILEKVAEKTKREERLEELSSSSWDDVRRGVAWNANTPPDTLSLLAKDHEDVVRRGVAWNANTPPSILSFLSKDQDEIVRSNVAENARTPQGILSILANDHNEEVRNTAKETLGWVLSKRLPDDHQR